MFRNKRFAKNPIAFALLLIGGAINTYAGGPAYIAGSGYDPGVEGQPLAWANGSIHYFTDQGNLSPILTGAQSDALVASAFATWTGVPGVALTASQAGHLAEDVSGGNIALAADGTIATPADITSSSITTPLALVYDEDGTVTEALLGQGAGSLADCFTNAVYGGPDNFSTAGNIVHALIVINGVCATTSAQLPDVQYRLMRILGRTIGVGWSQANINVLTRKPVPGSDDFEGFPVMHFEDPVSCVPIGVCYRDAAVPKMDDTDALARLYPGANPQPAGRVYGSVYFTDASGRALQQMQGVNVVARLMAAGQPSREYVATSVSGFAFTGNAGNIIDGILDANGLRYDRWGSSDSSLAGFYDLGELPIPSGQTIAEYQLSVEALDPGWSQGVEPYGSTQVTPSGTFAPVVVTVSGGSNAERDILMLQDGLAQPHPGSGSTYANPAPLPQGGAWGSWITGYGSADFFEFKAQANRTASVSVTALDEAGRPTETKLLPVVGIWQLSDQSGSPAPAATPSAFNSTTFALTRLDAQFGVTDTFRLAVADFRGDGRPDYFYEANLLYSDTISPARLSLAGGVAALKGTGFRPGLQVSAGGNSAGILSLSANQIQTTIPPAAQDGIASIQVTNPATGAFSQMIGALSYGALPTDLLLLLQGSEVAAVVGSQAASPIRVRAVAADGVTPVNGATVAWSGTNGLQFSACNGTSSCSALSDEAGESFTWVTPTAAGASTITAALAPAVYTPPQTQQTTITATSTPLDLVALVPTRWIGQGSTVAVPLTVEAVSLGVPKAGVPVNFAIMKGTSSLSSASATTNSSGLATINAQLTNLNAEVLVSACVAPGNSPCQTFTLFSTAPSLWKLETVSGSLQIVPIGQSFRPLVMRVTDGSTAANPVMGVIVVFETTLARADSNAAGNGLPILLGSSQAQIATDSDGLAAITPAVGNAGPCELFISVNAGSLTMPFQMESVAAIIPVTTPAGGAKVPAPPRNARIVFGATVAPSPPQAAPVVLFAIPESMPGNEPATDSRPPDCSELSPSVSADVSADMEGSETSSLTSTDHPVSAPAKLEPAETHAPQKMRNADSDITPGKAPAFEKKPTPKKHSPASAKEVIQDKRSCRALANDNPL